MRAELIALGAMLVLALAEWLHARRCRRVHRLAFGPAGVPRRWTQAVPGLRVAAAGLLAWGFVTLLLLGPQSVRSTEIPERGYRHLVIALDVSPSMQLKDAGALADQTRAKRASDVLQSLLQRIALDQVRISVIAFYTGAKRVVVDTFDMDVVKNVLNDLPLDIAFDVGKTAMMEGIREAAILAKPWAADSALLVVVSDGDTLPDRGFPQLPRAIAEVLIVGVGDARGGKYIDGHQSRQDASILRHLAARLKGTYFDANQKHLPSRALASLAKVLPLRDTAQKGKREWAVAAVVAGAVALSFIPVGLAMAGAVWQPARRAVPYSGPPKAPAAQGNAPTPGGTKESSRMTLPTAAHR